MASLYVSDLDWTPRLARSVCRRHGLSLTERGEVVRDGEVVATYELAARDVGPAWPQSRLAAGASPPPEAGRMRHGPSRVPLRAIATFVGLPEPAIRRALCFAEWAGLDVVEAEWALLEGAVSTGSLVRIAEALLPDEALV